MKVNSKLLALRSKHLHDNYKLGNVARSTARVNTVYLQGWEVNPLQSGLAQRVQYIRVPPFLPVTGRALELDFWNRRQLLPTSYACTRSVPYLSLIIVDVRKLVTRLDGNWSVKQRKHSVKHRVTVYWFIQRRSYNLQY